MTQRFLYVIAFFVSFVVYAENNQQIYDHAIDDINCKTTKLLLSLYKRAATARTISTCTYEEIQKGIGRVQENQLKGYKQKIAELSTTIDRYKTKTAANASPEDYEEKLTALNETILDKFRKICEEDRKATTEVCQELDVKLLGLQSDLSNITLQAITKMKTPVHSTATATEPVANAETERAVGENAPPTTDNDVETQETTTNSSSGGGSSFATTLLYLLVLGLGAGLGYLYKETTELKEQVEDLKTLVNILNKKH